MEPVNTVLSTKSPMSGGKDNTSSSRPSVDTTKRQNVETTAADTAAASLVRRILGSHQLNIASHTDQYADDNTHQVIDPNLPPLTSSNEIDPQLYALIAILIKDCVQSWYSRFTTDHTFVDELLQIIAHCTRALEERLRRADLERLLLDTIPAAIDSHVQTFRQCRDLAASRHLPGDDRVLYSTILPHTALLPTPNSPLSCDQQELHESTYRKLLAEGILALLVPAEDLRNPCLKSLLTEILADMILGGLVGKKLCDGIFIYDMIQRAADSARGASKPWAMETPSQPAKIDRLAHFGLLSPKSPTANQDITNVLWSIVGYLILIMTYVQTCLNSWIWTTKLPARSSPKDNTIHDAPHPDILDDLISRTQREEMTTTSRHSVHLPMISYHLWTMASTTINLPERMPWLVGSAKLSRHFLLQHFGEYDGYLDRVLAHVVLKPAFPLSKHLPSILLALRTSLFPENTMSSTKTTPTVTTMDPFAARQKACRGAAIAILNAVPHSIARLYLKPIRQISQDLTSRQRELDEVEQMVAAVERDILSPFGEDEYLTKHLLYTILDHIVLEIFPELSQKTVSQILAEKEVVSGSEQGDDLKHDAA